MPSDRTRITFGYEYLHDGRVADRGITSYQNRPAGVPIDTYYGNPDNSLVRADVNLASAMVEHRMGAATLRNRTLFGDYDRGYQNYVPGAASPTDARSPCRPTTTPPNRRTSSTRPTSRRSARRAACGTPLLLGAEVGRQWTDNFRNTGFFNNTATSILVPFDAPTIGTPVTFRQSATDADNHLGTNVAAAYVQDQVELSRHVQLVGGVRFDRFDLTYHNNRNGDTIGRIDNLVSPRAGHRLQADRAALDLRQLQRVVPAKLRRPVLLAHHHHGAARSRRSSTTTRWAPSGTCARTLSLTTAVYRLDRTNTRSTDPNDPTRIVQTGSQRTNGYELGLNGRMTQAWSIAGGYAYQDAFVTSATAAARAARQVARSRTTPCRSGTTTSSCRAWPRASA